MTTSHQKAEAIALGARMLPTALRPAIARVLEDLAVIEAMLNPDGHIWIDHLSEELADAAPVVAVSAFAIGTAAAASRSQPRRV